MSRLADRVLAEGCAPLRPFDLLGPSEMDEMLQELRAQASETGSQAPSAEALRAGQPTATEALSGAELENVPVIAAEEVAEYCTSFGPQTDPGDVVSVIAPPFDRFFVEFQGIPGQPFHAWGGLVEIMAEGARDEEVRWHVTVTLIVEARKGRPIGPVGSWALPIDQEGRWLRDDERAEYVSGGWLPQMSEPPPEDAAQRFLAQTVRLLLPVLMTVSFMHCRNVQAREVEPPELLTRKWQKKRGRPLVRYHVLDIEPMRRILDEQGQARSKGLAHAMHLCRGHFKTFTEEAPLFGRMTGQFWWADHVRGHADQGTVTKDYRVHVDHPAVGRPYEVLDEEATTAPPERTVFDPDAANRGRQAHNRTQNLLAEAAQRAGLQPRRPKPDESNYDLAWEDGGQTVVAEVKSLTESNEERQLRVAIGQVVRYRHQLSAGGRVVQAMIAVERKPTDETWLELCDEQGIILAWPELFDQATRTIASPDSR